ncbi:CrcB family protein [Cedecea davisae]|uniref:CrcB family protein n=1 Tax=Cedecea davisae TaxID=158484 RepID=UPI00242B9E02|nr:CrcB family protein [Cedecea davisae]
MVKPLFAVIVGGSAGFIIGGALALFLRQLQLDPVWKLLITTGLCGGMSTFSTFSVELFSLLQSGNYAWVMVSILAHVLGSLLMIAAGFFIINAVM